MQGKARGTYGSGCKVPGDYRGMPGELMGVGAKCQGNAEEYKGMQWERIGVGVNYQGMEGMQGNARGMHGSGCIVPGECRGPQRECKGVGVKC